MTIAINLKYIIYSELSNALTIKRAIQKQGGGEGILRASLCAWHGVLCLKF